MEWGSWGEGGLGLGYQTLKSRHQQKDAKRVALIYGYLSAPCNPGLLWFTSGGKWVADPIMDGLWVGLLSQCRLMSSFVSEHVERVPHDWLVCQAPQYGYNLH